MGVNGPPHANDSWNYHAKAAELKLLLCVALHTDVGDVGRKRDGYIYSETLVFIVK